MKKGGESVQRVLAAFTVADENRLYSLASGAPSRGSRDGRALIRSIGQPMLKLTSSDTYRAESQETSSTLSRRRNSRPWRLALFIITSVFKH